MFVEIFKRKDGDSFYTANTDISSIRLVLSEVAQKYGWIIGILDIDTAFLYASMPEEEELVYVKLPNLLVLFQLVAASVYWIASKRSM